MRRAIVVLAASAAMSVALALPLQADARPPKPVRYHLNVYDHFGVLVGEFTAYLTSGTHTWSVEGRCDGGTYTQSGGSLTLEDACQVETIRLYRVKHQKGVWSGSGAYALFELIKE